MNDMAKTKVEIVTVERPVSGVRLPDPPERADAPLEEPVARVLLMGAEERVVTAYRSVADAANLGVSAVEPGSAGPMADADDV